MFDTFFRSLFEVTPAMVILRGFSPDRAVDLAERAWDVGLTTVEIPLQRAADALSIERASAARCRGISTVVRPTSHARSARSTARSGENPRRITIAGVTSNRLRKNVSNTLPLPRSLR